MIYKPNFEEAKQYWNAFWEKEIIDRPAVCVTAPKNGVVRPEFIYTPAAAYRACVAQNEQVFSDFEAVAAATYYGGEAMPSLEITLGPDQFAGFLGAKIHDGAETTWADPLLDTVVGFSPKIDKSVGSYYDSIQKMIRAAAAYGKDKFFVNMLDLHSNMDALSALRGAQDLCFDLIDEPEEVQRVMGQIDELYADIFQMAYQAGDMAKRGSLGWAPTYCEQGKFAVIQCDFSCLLSPTQGKEFFIPSVEKEAAYLDHSVYHLDGKDAICHLDAILAIPQIDCIQWVPGEGQPRSLEWMPLLQKIQAAGKSLWIFDWTPEEIKAHFKELKPNQVVFSTRAKSQTEADELLHYLKTHL